MTRLNDIRAPISACRACPASAPPHLIAIWVRDASGRPERRWGLAGPDPRVGV